MHKQKIYGSILAFTKLYQESSRLACRLPDNLAIGQFFSLLSDINPIALRKAKIVYNFGLSECNRIKHPKQLL